MYTFHKILSTFNGISRKLAYSLDDKGTLEIFYEVSEGFFTGKTLTGYRQFDSISDLVETLSVTRLYGVNSEATTVATIGAALFLYFATAEDGSISINNARGIDSASQTYLDTFYARYYPSHVDFSFTEI
jgi:hypothetical protein